ncbi:RUN domain-containing protein 1 [Lutzomyia longipalpis]|uniref:RUN domain-containing protein 1 n=1 Tax=Lutzomyia longipalpis TaxID=7200 RepID=UPI0024834ED9|nr:RUN domain-containing protein 1 [Lutzomyia longipalpis]
MERDFGGGSEAIVHHEGDHINAADDESETEKPDVERWDPLGAANDSESDVRQLDSERDLNSELEHFCDINRIRNLEEEQEMLTSSLLALTSHFAQVQFRLRQIVKAAPEERDTLLKNLEEFAFRGIPEVQEIEGGSSNLMMSSVEWQRNRQQELIQQLKKQLEDLEKFAFESGEPVLPQSMLVEKQKVIIDEFRSKINLNLDEHNLPHLSPEDLRHQVDSALGEFVSPLKMKDQLVAQLKTQITDLERFIEFIQNADETVPGELDTNCDCISEEHRRKPLPRKHSRSRMTSSSSQDGEKRSNNTEGKFMERSQSIVKRVLTLLEIFTSSQIGCASTATHFQKNSFKKTARGSHWGDLRAQLEVDIQEICNFARKKDEDDSQDDSTSVYLSDSDSEPDAQVVTQQRRKKPTAKPRKQTPDNIYLMSIVRKRFAMTLLKLMQHGLRNPDSSSMIVPFISCFAMPKVAYGDYGATVGDEDDRGGKQMHAWELILEYYYIKNGDKYNETPARRLSQSFNLEIVGGTAISIKQGLLSTIGSIIALHAPYKRNHNSHFKAFVCAGLNTGKLAKWLQLIYQCPELCSTYYTSWSYAAKTGFRDALRSLEPLSLLKFDLPVDFAIRQFQNMNDVFQ